MLWRKAAGADLGEAGADLEKLGLLGLILEKLTCMQSAVGTFSGTKILVSESVENTARGTAANGTEEGTPFGPRKPCRGRSWRSENLFPAFLQTAAAILSYVLVWQVKVWFGVVLVV